MLSLTKKQKQIFDYIKSFIEKKGYSPTLEELKKRLRLKALSGVYQHIDALIDKGYIMRDENATRGLSIRDLGKIDTDSLKLKYFLLPPDQSFLPVKKQLLLPKP